MLQDTEIDEERSIALRIVFNQRVLQGLVRESLQQSTPFYHPLMSSMFRQVEESRRRLILCGLIYEEAVAPSSRPVVKDEEDADPLEKMPGSPALPPLRPGSPCSNPAENPALAEDAVEEVFEDHPPPAHDPDVEEPMFDMELDDNLPSNEELGIRPPGKTGEPPSVDPCSSSDMATSMQAVQEHDK